MLDYQAPRDLLKDKVILVTGAGDGITSVRKVNTLREGGGRRTGDRKTGRGDSRKGRGGGGCRNGACDDVARDRKLGIR